MSLSKLVHSLCGGVAHIAVSQAACLIHVVTIFPFEFANKNEIMKNLMN